MGIVKALSIAAIGAAALVGCGTLVDRRADFREAEAEARFGPVGELVKVGDTEVHMLVTGSGPDLVLIHGASGNMRDFTFDLVDRLKDRYRVFLFDRPGLGWTERLPAYRGAANTSGESPRAQARLLAEAGATKGLNNPIVLGHSFGGAVALAWGLEYPETTAAIVTLGGVSHPWPGDLSTFYTINASRLGGAVVVPALTAFAPDDRLNTAVTSIFAPDSVPEGYLRHVGGQLSMRRVTLRANAQHVKDLKDHVREMSEHYARTLKMPIEVLHGTADTIVGAKIHAEAMARDVPNARYTPLDGVGHMPHHARPDAVEAAIDRAAEAAGLR